VIKKICLELLAPAKNYEVGKAAIDAGADAVYIGALKFGARAAVGNSLQDVARLVEYAHFFRVKVYVALNTILYDDELNEAKDLIWEVWKLGVDAVIIQDMGILEMDLPPIQLFASTQTDNRTPEKVNFLEKVGFERVILARELSLADIKKIRQKTKIELECFVHGALCVCYSGQCYFSQALVGRSANRGVCAQPCRMKYDLVDDTGKVLESDKHLLSLKDFNLSNYIEELVDAGVTSFKIEGRLKDKDYVINNVAYYRKILDNIIKVKKKFVRASVGMHRYSFVPQPEVTFNRGFTSYFFSGRQKDILSPLTPKSLGEPIGRVVKVGNNWITLDQINDWQPGDGLCYFVGDNLVGTNINGYKDGKVYLHEMKGILVGTEVYRNFSVDFDKVIKNNKAVERLVPIDFILKEIKTGFELSVLDKDGIQVSVDLKIEKVIAENTELAKASITRQLSKLGGTGFVADKIECVWARPYFLSLATLNNLRRQAIEKITLARRANYRRLESVIKPNNIPYIVEKLDYRGNVSNNLSRQFYERHGVKEILPAFELAGLMSGRKIMTTKHCLRFYRGLCPKEGDKKAAARTWHLLNNGKKYRLEFDCANCEMSIIAE